MKLRNFVALSLPLVFAGPALALDLKDFKGNFHYTGGPESCLTKILLSPQSQALFVFDTKNGGTDLTLQLPLGKVKVGDKVTDGKIENETLTVQEFKSSLLGKKLLSTSSVRLHGGDLLLIKNQQECRYQKDAKAPAPGEPKILDITAAPKKKYVPLEDSFRNAGELLDAENADRVFDELENIKSATSQYHQEVSRMVTSAGVLSLEQIRMIPKLAYYSASDELRIRAKYEELEKDPGTDKAPGSAYAFVAENLRLAQNFHYVVVSMILSHADDLKDVSPEDFIDLMKLMPRSLYDGTITSEIVSGYQSRLRKLDLDAKNKLLVFYRANVNESVTGPLAAEVFQAQRTSFTLDELIAGSASVYPEKPLSVLSVLADKVSDLNKDNALKIIGLLKKDSEAISRILVAAGQNVNWSIDDVNQFKALGISLRTLHDSKIPISLLKQEGYSISEMTNAGFDLAKDLKGTYTLSDFVSAGYSLSYLRNLGYSAQEMKDIGKKVSDLANAGYDLQNEVKPLFTLKDFFDAGYSLSYLRSLGYSAQEMKAIGKKLSDLANAGFDLQTELKKLFTLKDFLDAGYNLSYLRSIGYTSVELKAAGKGVTDLANAGFDLQDDLKRIFTLRDFLNAGYSLSYLRSLGFTSGELKKEGKGLTELANAGFDLQSDLKKLFTLQDFLAAGYSISYLRNIGYSASDFKALGKKVDELANAGFDIQSELKPLYTPAEFVSANYGFSYLRSWGFTAKELRSAGATIAQLVQAGYTEDDLKAL